MTPFNLWNDVFLPMRQSSIVSSAGKFSLTHGLGQLSRDTESDISCLHMSFTHRNEKVRMTFRIGRHTTLIVKNVIKQLP